ncbi:pre-mRNA-splicing factor rse1 [Coemansia sp. Benny D115]|nr:pre-mRNA-splicing factor rse1 [Coemansia sp. Benny D115]
MFLYNLTLQPASAVIAACLGHFTGSKTQELLVARPQHLELWRMDAKTGKLSTMHSMPAFARIRSLATLRLPGSSRDVVLVSSDSSAALIMECTDQGHFRILQMHEFARTGLRRSVPGQYIAADPQGRAFMVAAIEKSKLVYVVTRDAEAGVLLRSPLEANRSQAICVDITGVDVGYENPVFAALEIEEGGAAVAHYELDLGLNHVVRRWSRAVADTANRLIPLPGGDSGPGGVLVCSEGVIQYCSPAIAASQPLPRVEIPRRTDQETKRAQLIVASAVHRMRAAFFILAQTEAGDLFKVTVVQDGESGQVNALGISYFDTIAPASCLCILRAGFLFAGSSGEGSGQRLYQFESLGDTDPVPDSVLFEPRELQNLALVDEVEGLSPLVRAQVMNLAEEDAPQVYALSGRGEQASLRIARFGLEAAELAVTELPGSAQGIWALADGLMAVSFRDATLVLRIDSEDIAEVPDSSLLTTEPTLALHACSAGGLVQATSRALRRTYADGRAAEWQPPRGLRLTTAALNTSQAVVAAGTERAFLFELDTQGELREAAHSIDAPAEVLCAALPSVPPGRRGALFAAIGCADSTVRLYALHRDAEPVAMQALPDLPSSVVLTQGPLGLLLFVGLNNGLLLRASVDPVTGELSDPRTRFLGARAVRLREAAGGSLVVALATQPWVCHVRDGRLHTVPLAYDALDDLCGIPTEDGGVQLAGVGAGSLRILSLDRLDAEFNQAAIPLSLTPRDMVLNADSRHFAVIEAQAAVGGGSPGQWSSLVRVLNPFDGQTTQLIELEANEAAVSMAPITFADHPQQQFLAVGCVTGLTLRPRAFASACIRLFRWSDDGTQLELLHATSTDDVPQALLAFNGQLLVALGRSLRLYDLGQRQLLRRTQTPVAPYLITSLHAHPTRANRLFVGDVQESVQLVVYDTGARAFQVIVDDSAPRYATCFHVLDDGATVAGGDRFGNLFVLRVPAAVDQALDTAAAEGATGAGRLAYAKPRLGASAHRWDVLAEFHVGDIPTSITACSLAPGARPVLFYGTLLGSLQAAIPFVSQGDIDFFLALEAQMRRKYAGVGRDHKKFRSAFRPVRAVVDGDLCEQFNMLTNAQRGEIAEAVDRTEDEIYKKLEDMRTLFTF